ncbi:four helix bundle protein [Candidatus Nomurabacteria bacterium]|jgi:four helix bundle protein|nr:four helix bundle protein [Candidatus Nomurabacteria bacterium]
MNNTHTKITRFEDMTVWQEAQEFAVAVYKVTKHFPEDERFGIISQLRRASSSVSANIAEGFGRSSKKDTAHFYHIARGSLLESKNFIYLSARLSYIDKGVLDKLITNADSINQQITAILRYFKIYA